MFDITGRNGFQSDTLNSWRDARMRLLTPLAVFVVAILTSQSRSSAEEAPVPPEGVTPVTYRTGDVCPPGGNGYDQYRQQPDSGSPSSPAHGFKHFMAPLHAFSTWYRPRAATLTSHQRCAEEPFRPRGYGNLFAKQCDPFRMEYSPYTLGDSCSKYGPSYLIRMRDARCQNCGH